MIPRILPNDCIEMAPIHLINNIIRKFLKVLTNNYQVSLFLVASIFGGYLLQALTLVHRETQHSLILGSLDKFQILGIRSLLY